MLSRAWRGTDSSSRLENPAHTLSVDTETEWCRAQSGAAGVSYVFTALKGRDLGALSIRNLQHPTTVRREQQGNAVVARLECGEAVRRGAGPVSAAAAVKSSNAPTAADGVTDRVPLSDSLARLGFRRQLGCSERHSLSIAEVDSTRCGGLAGLVAPKAGPPAKLRSAEAAADASALQGKISLLPTRSGYPSNTSLPKALSAGGKGHAPLLLTMATGLLALYERSP